MKTVSVMMVLMLSFFCLSAFSVNSKISSANPVAQNTRSASAQAGCKDVDCTTCSFDDESCEQCCATTRPSKGSDTQSSSQKIKNYDGSKD